MRKQIFLIRQKHTPQIGLKILQNQGFPNCIKEWGIPTWREWEILLVGYEVVRTWGGVIFTNKNILQILNIEIFKVEISMACVYKYYEV